jgi:hypothetical protein
MNSNAAVRQALIIAVAVVVAAAVYWLSSEFRPSGVLGVAQVSLQPLVVVPYLAAAVLSGSPHAPSSLLFGLALFAQFYVVFLLAALLWRRLVAKRGA